MLHKKVPQPVGCGTFWFAARGNRSGRVEYLLHAAPRGDFRHRSTNSGGAAMTSAAPFGTAHYRTVSQGAPKNGNAPRRFAGHKYRGKGSQPSGLPEQILRFARQRQNFRRPVRHRSPADFPCPPDLRSLPGIARVTCPASPASFPPGLFLVSFPSFLPLSFPSSPCASSRTAG